MARQVRQTLPDPPAQYDQAYIAALARSINSYMSQAQALGEVIAGRFIMTDPVHIPAKPSGGGGPPDGQPDTTGLKVGTLYLKQTPSGYFLTVVEKTDP